MLPQTSHWIESPFAQLAVSSLILSLTPSWVIAQATLEQSIDERVLALENAVTNLDARSRSGSSLGNDSQTRSLETRLTRLENQLDRLMNDLQRIERTADAAMREATDARREAQNAASVARDASLRAR